MEPLTHARATVVKLHGDYASLGLRNTPDELGEYPDEWNSLLARVFDEYGLVAVGWSAAWDRALCGALASVPNRRYPMYWAAHEGNLTEDARRLIATRRANVIAIPSADEFLTDLTERLGRLDAIATRRARPQLSRVPAFMPDQSTAPQGWEVMPLLHLHIVASVAPVTFETAGYIQPEHRARVVEMLDASAVSERVRTLAHAVKPASALATPLPGTVTAARLDDWILTPRGNQTLDAASYRLGGDAAVGIAALATVRPPSFGAGGQLLFLFDLGVSIEPPLSLQDAVLLIRDALVLVTADLPAALGDLLPADAEVTQAEAHIFAPPTDGKQAERSTELTERLDLSLLGESTRSVGPLMGFQARLSGALTESDASDLTIAGLEFMALSHGWTDPRVAVAQLRDALA
jgi:hypothetical protein